MTLRFQFQIVPFEFLCDAQRIIEATESSRFNTDSFLFLDSPLIIFKKPLF